MVYCIRKLLGLADKNFIPDKIWLETIVENNETEHKIRITGCSTNPVGEKSPTGFFVCKKEESEL